MTPVRGAARAPVVIKRRGGFGLADVRVVDPRRTEADILAWIAATLPGVVPLRVAEIGPETEPRTLALVERRGRAVILRVEGRPRRPDRADGPMVARCRAEGIPVAVVRSLAEARAALRRFGLEPGRRADAEA